MQADINAGRRAGKLFSPSPRSPNVNRRGTNLALRLPSFCGPRIVPAGGLNSNHIMKHFGSTRTFAALLALFAATATRIAWAATTNLFPAADTYIRDSTPASNFGVVTPLLVGISATGTPRQRCLFRFTIDGIPADAVVTSATLRLIAVGGPREAFDFDLNRLLVDWTEGGASWATRLPATPWTEVGGAAGTDFVASPSATAKLSPVPIQVAVGGQPVTNDFNSPGMVADVQLWLDDPATNFGWILHVTGGQFASGRQLASREHATLKPVLIVEYTTSEPPAPAPPPTIVGTELNAGTIHFSFKAESNRTYTVEFRDSLTASQWAILTNIPAQPDDATIHITNSTGGDERYFRVGTP